MLSTEIHRKLCVQWDCVGLALRNVSEKSFYVREYVYDTNVIKRGSYIDCHTSLYGGSLNLDDITSSG